MQEGFWFARAGFPRAPARWRSRSFRHIPDASGVAEILPGMGTGRSDPNRLLPLSVGRGDAAGEGCPDPDCVRRPAQDQIAWLTASSRWDGSVRCSMGT